MQIVLIKKDRLCKYPFPNELMNTYWVNDTDSFGNERSLIMLSKGENAWTLEANDICKIIDNGKEIKSVNLARNTFYKLLIHEKASSEEVLLYICNENDKTYKTYQVTSNGEYTIGSSATQNIIITGTNILEEHAILTRENNRFTIRAKTQESSVYVNNYRVMNKTLENGDTIFIMGYKIIILNDLITINSFMVDTKINANNIVESELPQYNGELLPTTDNDDAELFTEKDYFSRSPRFVTTIVDEEIKIDSPPGKIEPDDTPVIYTVGPMLTMAMSSVFTASLSAINIINGNGSIVTALPTIVIAVFYITMAKLDEKIYT